MNISSLLFDSLFSPTQTAYNSTEEEKIQNENDTWI